MKVALLRSFCSPIYTSYGAFIIDANEEVAHIRNKNVYRISQEGRGSVVVSTSAWHAPVKGSIPGPGMFHY